MNNVSIEPAVKEWRWHGVHRVGQIGTHILRKTAADVPQKQSYSESLWVNAFA